MAKLLHLIFGLALLAVSVLGQTVVDATPSPLEGYDLSHQNHPHFQDLDTYDYYAIQLVDSTAIPTAERYFGLKFIERIGWLDEWYLFRTGKSDAGPAQVQAKFAKLARDVDREERDYRLVAQLKGRLLHVDHQVPRAYEHDHGEF